MSIFSFNTAGKHQKTSGTKHMADRQRVVSMLFFSIDSSCAHQTFKYQIQLLHPGVMIQTTCAQTNLDQGLTSAQQPSVTSGGRCLYIYESKYEHNLNYMYMCTCTYRDLVVAEDFQLYTLYVHQHPHQFWSWHHCYYQNKPICTCLSMIFNALWGVKTLFSLYESGNICFGFLVLWLCQIRGV